MKIGTDLDGTLTIETEGHDYESRTPNLPMIEKVNQWREEGHYITIFSSRWEVDKRVTLKWLKLNGVSFDELILGKPGFDLYIDDIAMRPEEIL